MASLLEREEMILLERSLKEGLPLRFHVRECRFACCGRGFVTRTGYEQTYVGVVAHIELNGLNPSSVRVNGLGFGTIAFIMEAAVDDIELVERR